MALIWVIAVRIGNAGIVDIAWSAGFAPIAILFAVPAGRYPCGASCLLQWSASGACDWAAICCLRVISHHPQEDRRYARLRRAGAAIPIATCWLFSNAGGAAGAPVRAGLLVCMNPQPRLQPLEWLGVLLWGVALSGESLRRPATAALQGRSRQSRRASAGVGLWRYSRHPNYFFEWLVWVAYFLFALARPGVG